MEKVATKNTKSTKKTWPMVRLGDVCEFVRRGKSPIYCETSPYPMFAQKCNQPNGIFLDKCKFCEPAKYLKFDKEYRLQDKDILINSTGTGTLGRVGFFREEYLQAFNYESIVADSHVTIVRMNNQVLQEYLYLFMRQDFVYKWLNDIANGSTNQKELYPQHLVRLEFPLPPLSVQREIVARLEKELGDADALAAKFKEIAENADAEFKAELDETFKTVEGEKVRLGDVCEKIIDCPHTTAPDEGEGFPLVRTPNVGLGRLVYANMHRVSEVVYKERVKRGVPQSGDLIFAREAPAGNVAVIQSGEKVCLGQRTVLLKPREKINSDWLAYYILSPASQERLLTIASGSTVTHVNVCDIKRFEITLVPIADQRAIVTKLDAAKNRCEKLKSAALRGLAAAENMRKAILSEAFEQP